MTPYEILGIDRQTDDQIVRQAYLELVRRFPPDRYPDRFRMIHDAYEQLKDEKSRLAFYLFDREPGMLLPFAVLREQTLDDDSLVPPDFNRLQPCLRRWMSQ